MMNSQVDKAEDADVKASVREGEEALAPVESFNESAETQPAEAKNPFRRLFRRSRGTEPTEVAADEPRIRPIRLVMGYLPEVSRRDAIEYAQGIASKYFDQQGLAYYGAFEHANGFVYEVQEGGDGKAYAPGILQHFEEQGPFDSQRVDSVVVASATRMVQVQRLREGLSCVLLPQTATTEPTEWLKTSSPLEPALNRRRLFFMVGAFMLGSGLTAMLTTGLFFRLQDFEPVPEVKPELVSASALPRSQWMKVASLPPNTYVKAIRFKNGKWEAPEVAVEAPVMAASAASTPASVPAR